ncbi:MAG TPA: hypothetical protein VEK07_17170 [Polyangiaceae bacterium]|nr:hypothetical protein [Polyangiaceae bacterium]
MRATDGGVDGAASAGAIADCDACLGCGALAGSLASGAARTPLAELNAPTSANDEARDRSITAP